MEVAIIVFWVLFAVTRKLNKESLSNYGLNADPSSTRRIAQDKLNQLFKSVDQSNDQLTETVHSGETNVVFSESQDKIKSVLYFNVFKFVFGGLFIAIISVIYAAIIS